MASVLEWGCSATIVRNKDDLNSKRLPSASVSRALVRMLSEQQRSDLDYTQR